MAPSIIHLAYGDGASWPGLVTHDFDAGAPDRLWVTGIIKHRTTEGWVHAAAVLDACTRRVAGR